MILRPKARDQFYSWYVNSKHDWSCIYNFSLITFAQICSLIDHSLPNVRDVVKAAVEGAREGFTEAVANAAMEEEVSKVRAEWCIFQEEEFLEGSIITSGRAFVTERVFNKNAPKEKGINSEKSSTEGTPTQKIDFSQISSMKYS